MTQHDETRSATDQPVPPPGQPGLSTAQHGPGGDQPGQPGTGQPLLPSPYLDAGGSLPQAYLAPPQPGQPEYGAPPRPRSGGPPFGLARPGARRQAYGQSGYEQPGYGRRSRTRGALGPQTRRDPVIAAPWERLAGSVLDWIVIFAIATLAFISPLLQVWRQLQTVTTQYPDLNSPGAQAALDAISRDPANQRALLFWFLAMFGIALAYYWIQHAAWGATIGKRALGTRVVTASDRSAIGVRAAGIRAVAFLVGPATFLLLQGPFNIPGGLLWLADTGLVLLDLRAQCLHDKLAGTIVISQRRLAQQARSARPW